jgi:hypothetical protein
MSGRSESQSKTACTVVSATIPVERTPSAAAATGMRRTEAPNCAITGAT